MLDTKEVEFLFGHEVLHVVYDHMGRRGDRNPKMFNVANDYAVNADLRRHKVGQFITTVPCLYEAKYDGKSSEYIYDDLMKNVQQIDLDELLDQLIDEHMDADSEDGDGDGNTNRPKKMSDTEREQLRQEIKQNIFGTV
jgi:predicted metal-dependent peptidase